MTRSDGAQRLLLTSAGLRNQTLYAELGELLGRPFEEARVVVVLTASLAEPGDKRWLLDDLAGLSRLGWAELDLIDLNTIAPDDVRRRMGGADVVYVHGGNQYSLVAAIARHGLDDAFEEVRRSAVYVGVSAGSILVCERLDDESVAVFGDADMRDAAGLDAVAPPLGWLPGYVKPHLNSASFTERTEAWAHERARAAAFPIWFLDDGSALRVRGDEVEVVGEGEALLLR